MPEIRFYGASDDLIEVEGCEGADEFNTTERGPMVWCGDLIAPGGDAMRIHALYDNRGCWSFSIGQADKSIPFPEWPVRVRQHTNVDYSVLLTVDAPEGTRLTSVWPENGDG